MSGTEASFVKKLNKRPALANTYNCGMGGMYVGGIPDRYYEGRKILWVEYKHIKKDTHQFNAPKALSGLQLGWLLRCYGHGHNPHVIVGVGLSWGFMLETPAEWEHMWTPAEYQLRMLSIDEIADYIARFCNGTR